MYKIWNAQIANNRMSVLYIMNKPNLSDGAIRHKGL